MPVVAVPVVAVLILAVPIVAVPIVELPPVGRVVGVMMRPLRGTHAQFVTG